MATGFYPLLAWRIVTGIGSSGIVTLAGPFIDDIAPVSAKTLWFGMLYLVRLCFLAHLGPSPPPPPFLKLNTQIFKGSRACPFVLLPQLSLMWWGAHFAPMPALSTG